MDVLHGWMWSTGASVIVPKGTLSTSNSFIIMFRLLAMEGNGHGVVGWVVGSLVGLPTDVVFFLVLFCKEKEKKKVGIRFNKTTTKTANR